jgi:hypothetical protein
VFKLRAIDPITVMVMGLGIVIVGGLALFF